MNEMYTSSALEGVWKESLDNARKNYDRARRRRDAAAISDFAANLLSFVGRNSGMRYNVGTKPLSGSANDKYEQACERYSKALIDYKGKIAGLNLRNSVASAVKNEKQPASIHFVPFVGQPQGNAFNHASTNIMDDIKKMKTPYWLTKK